MDAQSFLINLVIPGLLICISDASHFRGGTVSWKYKSSSSHGDAHQVEVNFRFGWRRDWETPQCDDFMISSLSESYVTTGGSWSISTTYSYPSNTSSSSNPPTSIICTAYDILENWAYGYNSFIFEVYTTDPFTISYRGSAWIGGLYGSSGGSWAVPAVIDLGIRSDTGNVNNPPRTFSSPIVRLQQGCPSTIKITSLDDDGDRVTCRYAGVNNTLISDECAGVCNVIYPHFALDADTCTIYYDGGAGTYLIPVALMLEDHPSSTITVNGSRVVTSSDYLSQIPLQFLVDISSTTACNVVPTYPPGTISENDTIAVSDNGGTLDEVLEAYPSDASAVIIQFIALGPLGVQTSPPIYINATGAYASNITWRPDPSQTGRHIICYYAVDSLGKTGPQVCFTVVVTGVGNPCDVDNGGCNDVCVPKGSVRTCECSLPCWYMLDNMRTCAPSLDVTCDGSGMQISMPVCASDKTIVVGTNQDVTKPSCQSSSDGVNHQLRFTRDECSVSVWSNPYQLLYNADLWIWNEDPETSSIITRGEWKRIPVTCTVSTSSGTVNGSFVPQLPFDYDFFPSDVTIDGMGEYSFYFEFYNSGSFSTAVAPVDYPLQVSVSDRMYFSLGAVGLGGLVFFTDECTATTTDVDGITTLSYTFIRNGCFLDSTLVRHYTPSNMEDRFSMQAFEFENKLLADRADAEIFIQCEVMLCDASNNSTRCFQGCQSSSSRKKRSSLASIIRWDNEGRILSRIAREVDDDEESARQLTRSESPLLKTTSGFILRAEEGPSDSGSSGNDAVTSGESSNYLYWVLIAIGILVLVVALFVAYRLLKMRKTGSKKKLTQFDFGHQNEAAHIDT